MELDEWKEKWAEYDRKLDESLRLNRRLMRESYTARARWALRRLAAMLALGSILTLAVIVWLGRFIAVNWPAARFTVPAILLDAAAIATLAALNAQIGMALNIDYNQPVTAIQKRLEMLRRFRVRYVQVICLLMTLTWTPIFIVAMKAVLDVDVNRTFPIGWLIANAAFGLAVLVVALWLARRYGARFRNTAFGERLVRDLGGYNLNAASAVLATIAEFEKE
ncbi:MAG TPA: hypothetical protein VIY49_09220 [Bryobacteraceae bacterium]